MGGALVNARDGQRLGEDAAVGTDLDEKNPTGEGSKEGGNGGGKEGKAGKAGKAGKTGSGSAAGAGRRESAPPPSNLRVQSFASPLMWAASEGRPKIVAGLLAAGASIDSRDMEGYTALHRAAAGGKVKCLEILLDSGAEVDLRTAKWMGWRTPLMEAAR